MLNGAQQMRFDALEMRNDALPCEIIGTSRRGNFMRIYNDGFNWNWWWIAKRHCANIIKFEMR